MKYLGPAIFLLCCLTALQPCFGQTINLDSLWTIWNDSTQADTNRLKAMQDIAWDGYLYSQPDSAFYLAGLQYELAETIGNKKWMGTALNTQGVSYKNRSNYEQALEYHNKSLKIKEEIGCWSTQDIFNPSTLMSSVCALSPFQDIMASSSILFCSCMGRWAPFNITSFNRLKLNFFSLSPPN